MSGLPGDGESRCHFLRVTMNQIPAPTAANTVRATRRYSQTYCVGMRRSTAAANRGTMASWGVAVCVGELVGVIDGVEVALGMGLLLGV